MPEICLNFENLTLGYSGRPAVHHITGTVPSGALIAVAGPNGSGKSTLMKGIAGFLKPISGDIKINNRRLAYLPQQSEIDRSFPSRVADLVSLGLWQERGLLGRHTKADKARIEAALNTVGLNDFEERSLDGLSGGQFQRALFARTILQDADLILLDEPFNAVDTKTVTDLIALIKQWHREGRTVLAVLHDYSLVKKHFPETILLARELVGWGPTEKVMTPEHLVNAMRFQEAWDETADWCEHDKSQSLQAGDRTPRVSAHV